MGEGRRGSRCYIHTSSGILTSVILVSSVTCILCCNPSGPVYDPFARTLRPMNQPTSRINDTLPPEIISVIFQCVVLRDDADATDTGPPVERHILITVKRARTVSHFLIIPRPTQSYLSTQTLSQVCRHWRSIALGTPALWRKVFVNDTTSDVELQDVLQKSGSLTIDIDIRIDSPKPHHFMGLIAEQVRRWATFCCYVGNHAILLHILASLKGLNAPNLEILRISDTSEEGDSPDDESRGITYPLFNGPSSTPQLRALDLWGLRLDWMNHSFANLTRLEMGLIPDGT